MRYAFLIETYASERVKVISAWSMFQDGDLPVRPHPSDRRGRSIHEQMVHQCVSEDLWFRTMLGIEVCASPLPKEETRLEFMRQYEGDSARRLAILREKDEAWWEGETTFFDVRRSRAWVMTRRMTHTSHHRGQQLAMLRMLNRDEHSNYGPTADTGGLMQNKAPTIYPYSSLEALFEGERAGGRKHILPGPGPKPVTERPDAAG
ncbi:DinB family protein [Paludibaculum fermentans]|uniref:DinB family protein n=1 Tax=Paludibaculum fermentans TaxID=1473598 RepID=UPI003EBD1C86